MRSESGSPSPIPPAMERNNEADSRSDERIRRLEEECRARDEKIAELKDELSSKESELDGYQERYESVFNEAGTLEQAREVEVEKNKNLEKDIQEKNTEIGELRQQDGERNELIASLESEMQSLRQQLADEADRLRHEEQSNKDAGDLLTRVYADLKAAEGRTHAVEQERDDWKIAQYDTQMKLDSLREEWEETQEQLEELERIRENMDAFERMQDETTEEIQKLNDVLRAKDHEARVKDSRIADLEAQLQHALTKAERAETAVAEADAAKAPTDAPSVPILSPGESLQEELDGYDFIHEDDEEHVEPQFVGVLEHASIETAPMEALPALEVTHAASLDTAPIKPASPQPNLDLSTVSHVFDSAPEWYRRSLQLSDINSAADIAPITPLPVVERSTVSVIDTVPQQPDANLGLSIISAADVSSIDVLQPSFTDDETQTQPVEEPAKPIDDAKVSPSTITSVVTTPIPPTETKPPLRDGPVFNSPTLKASTSTNSQTPMTTTATPPAATATQTATPLSQKRTLLSRLLHPTHSSESNTFLLLFLSLWIVCLAYEIERVKHVCTPNENGAYGAPSLLFGLWPMGFDVGGSHYLSEWWGRRWAMVLYSIEEGLGVSRRLPH
ncbi:hypothetical protein M011DRAFT_52499 [Sporormia fimetaria CBS 119925]|uniref:NUDE domain-containing protein n=1 Tax=Sporormia fimetaria CBS 119925 TaxID=1340428 RepID=A0A6A6VBG1_9PLEO|nr:hypothetical protein M011DRAFT_52499 [Sporormia fimetaria CBS 119925]